MASIELPNGDLLGTLLQLGLRGDGDAETVSEMRKAAEGRAVQLPGVHAVTDRLFSQLAAGFSRGEPGKLTVPYARLED